MMIRILGYFWGLLQGNCDREAQPLPYTDAQIAESQQAKLDAHNQRGLFH